MSTNTEYLDPELLDLDTRSNEELLTLLLQSQQQAIDAVAGVQAGLDAAIADAAKRLISGDGRICFVGAGASGRIAVQDGAELWPTYGWPLSRTCLRIAGGDQALIRSVEGIEDDADAAEADVDALTLDRSDVVVALAASGRSRWTVAWAATAKKAGALCIGIANNPRTPLLSAVDHSLYLDSGTEVLGGSTRMTAGTAQKIVLNLFSTALMIRLNRTYGNLMVDMAAVNAKLDDRRIRMMQAIDPEIDPRSARAALDASEGWVKLAAIVAKGVTVEQGRTLLEQHHGSLRAVLTQLSGH